MKKPITLIEENGAQRLSLSNDLSSHLSTHAYLYLQPNGWFNDYPCDEEGVTPWMTFPAISFLKDIVSKDTKVFEYGSGFSTIFFNQRAGKTVTVEHDPVWVDTVKAQVPESDIFLLEKHAQINEQAAQVVNDFITSFPQVRTDNIDHDLRHGLVNNEFAGYASKLYDYPRGHFDIIVLDGMARSLTGVMAVERANHDSLIVLDNSDRWHYNHLQQYLVDKGYRRIDFWGPGWNNYNAWCTSFFFRMATFKNHRLTRQENQGPIFT